VFPATARASFGFTATRAISPHWCAELNGQEDFRMSDGERKIAVEEVEQVTAPPGAGRGSLPAEAANEKLERKRDYLEGFLSEKPTAEKPANPAAAPMTRSSMR
jgi:hypothetical protein